MGTCGPRPTTAKTRLLTPHSIDQPGLTAGPKTTHVKAKVPPRLFAEVALRAGSTSPAIVITAALAALATEDELGPWLARRWGSLVDIDSGLLAACRTRFSVWPAVRRVNYADRGCRQWSVVNAVASLATRSVLDLWRVRSHRK
jgi:hypothetical protein